MNCQKARASIARAAEGVVTDADFRRHIADCESCRAILEDQVTVRYLLSALPAETVPVDFATHVTARLEPRALLLDWTDWKSWTLRLAPLAAGLAVIAAIWSARPPTTSHSLESVMETWLAVRGQIPATGLFWHDAPHDSLLEAVLDGEPDSAMDTYYSEGPND